MMSFFNTFAQYLSYDFVKYALIAGVLVSLCAALLGVTLVLKRYSMIGDGLSHVAFGALATAAVLNIAPMYFTLPVTVAAAVLLLKAGQSSKIKGDAAIAMISAASLALGYMLMNLYPTNANISGDVCTSLFGSTSILTLSETDIYICLALATAVILLYILFYNRLFCVTFDESFASATGTNSSAYKFSLAVVTGIVIVIAMNLVGALLISALIIFPALSAMRVFKSFKAVTVSSAIIAVVSSLLGIIISIFASTPVGATIVTADAVVFVVFSIIGKIAKK